MVSESHMVELQIFADVLCSNPLGQHYSLWWITWRDQLIFGVGRGAGVCAEKVIIGRSDPLSLCPTNEKIISTWAYITMTLLNSKITFDLSLNFTQVKPNFSFFLIENFSIAYLVSC